MNGQYDFGAVLLNEFHFAYHLTVAISLLSTEDDFAK